MHIDLSSFVRGFFGYYQALYLLVFTAVLKFNCPQWNFAEETCSQTLAWQRTRCVCVRALTVRDTGTAERTHRLRPLPWPRSEVAVSRGGGQLEGSMAYIAAGHMG